MNGGQDWKTTTEQFFAIVGVVAVVTLLAMWMS